MGREAKGSRDREGNALKIERERRSSNVARKGVHAYACTYEYIHTCVLAMCDLAT